MYYIVSLVLLHVTYLVMAAILGAGSKYILYTRAKLFKTNNVISYHIVKTLIFKYGIYINIFAETKYE